MANVPFPITGTEEGDLKRQLNELVRQIYEEKIGGADLGDVFSLPGDVLTLVTDETTLSKEGNVLTTAGSTGAFTFITQIQPDGAAPSGIDIKTQTITVTKGLITNIGTESGWTQT